MKCLERKNYHEAFGLRQDPECEPKAEANETDPLKFDLEIDGLVPEDNDDKPIRPPKATLEEANQDEDSDVDDEHLEKTGLFSVS